MSYLLQYARRPDSIAPRTTRARVDEYNGYDDEELAEMA